MSIYNKASPLILWLSLIGVTVESVHLFRAPQPLSAAASPDLFSAGRAAADLPAIAAQPHSVGSKEHEAVRERLIERLRSMGFEPEVQSGTGITTVQHIIVASSVSNILARLPGTRSTGAVLLAAHYDSVTTGPGAGDDGAGVVTLLETLRALKHSPPLNNDVMVLFTDSEEHGLTGAEFYMTSHATSSPGLLVHEPVSVVLNFDNRGDRGVVNMFEASGGDSRLIEALARTPAAFGSSLLSTAYQYLPNNTDFTIFRQGGLAGLNFAMGERLESYHTQLDTPGNVSRASLQQMGSYALPLAKEFGMADLHLVTAPAPDAVFFNPIGSGLVHYSVRWVRPLEIALSLWLIVCLIYRAMRRNIKTSMVILSVLLVLFATVITALVMGSMILILQRFAGSSLQGGDTPSNGLLLLGSVVFGCGCAVSLHALGRRIVGTDALASAGFWVFWMLSILVSFRFPGSSYLFFWPLAIATAGLTLQPWIAAAWQPLFAGLVSLPGILLFAPLFFIFYVFLMVTPLTAAVIGIGIFLLCGLYGNLTDALSPTPRSTAWLLGVAAVVAVTCSAAFLAQSSFTAEHPHPDSIAYSINLDTQQAAWISSDSRTDAWTARFLGNQPSVSTRHDLGSLVSNISLWKAAPPLPSMGPRLVVERDAKQDTGREVELLLVPQQAGDRVELSWADAPKFTMIAIKDRLVNLQVGNHDPGNLGLTGMPDKLLYFGAPPEGIAIRLRMPSGSRLSLDVMEQIPGLPAVADTPALRDRPNNFVPAPGSDVTCLRRSFHL